jgi:hypothetical protein
MSGERPVQGKVVALGVPVRDVEVLAVAGSTVLATTVTDRDGCYAFGALGHVERVVARFVEPFIGVVGRSGTTPDITLEHADIVRLVGRLAVPPGVTFDWADIKLTPRGDVPPVVTLKDPDGLREAYWIRRLVEPGFQIRVIRGAWDLRAHRIVDGPLSTSPPVNLGTAAVILPDGSRAPLRLGGFEFLVEHDLSVTVELRMLTSEEP